MTEQNEGKSLGEIYEEKYDQLELAVREMQEAWALFHGNTPGSLVTDWQLSTSARNINEEGNAITQVMVIGGGAGEVLMGISRLSNLFWEQNVLKTYNWEGK